MSEVDNFVLVTRRGKRRNGRRNLGGNATTSSVTEEQDSEIDLELLLRTLDKTIVEIRDTSFTRFVVSRLTESLAVLGSNGISEIICYGLGQFSQYRSSRCQLGLLLCLKARYEPARVLVYDPVFRPEEVRALRTLDLDVIDVNEEGKRVIQRDRTTLVYMPHCSRQLTNNFLYANWGDGLSDCILLANSLSRIVDTCLHKDIIDMAGYILRIQPYVTEIRLENFFAYEEVFNDLNIHIFTKQDLLKVPADFWSSREEPRYIKDVEFITATK
ncbi:SRR1-like protein isoform X1 [Pogonomyrmex barbatus]|uniref:SRR1-like protein isoform X1 n=1 Tax=Pogonomyrmex barbatus TaxID=144034 RepID=A0A6I9WF49_9HYME|nr:SRR1-like protein isoform X1 [Pogonomyrmex barbatus]